MTKQEIITATVDSFSSFTKYCKEMDERSFFEKKGDQWSAAENVQHLIIATNTSTLAWQLPKFLVRWAGGTPNRASRSFDELVARYNSKLQAGGKASGRYIPKPLEIKYGKEKLMGNWEKAGEKFITLFSNNRSEKDLDNYLVRHPLLGRITLRELCYFTIYHTKHHLNNIHKIFSPQ